MILNMVRPKAIPENITNIYLHFQMLLSEHDMDDNKSTVSSLFSTSPSEPDSHQIFHHFENHQFFGKSTFEFSPKDHEVN